MSATLPHEVLEMTHKFMTDPVRVLVKRDELTLEGIKQFFVAVEREEWKFDTLCDLYDHAHHHASRHLLQHKEKGGRASGSADRVLEAVMFRKSRERAGLDTTSFADTISKGVMSCQQLSVWL